MDVGGRVIDGGGGGGMTEGGLRRRIRDAADGLDEGNVGGDEGTGVCGRGRRGGKNGVGGADVEDLEEGSRVC